MKSLLAVISPYGIGRLVKGPGCHKNKKSSKTRFPNRRFHFLCGSCDTGTRGKDFNERGCCGFKIRMLLINGDGDEPYLEVKEFRLPEKSKHLLMSDQNREASKNTIINNEEPNSPLFEAEIGEACAEI